MCATVQRIDELTIHTVAQAQHQHCGTSVQTVTRGDNVTTAHQLVILVDRAIHRFAIDREDRTDRHETVDVRRAVQRIERADVFTYGGGARSVINQFATNLKSIYDPFETQNEVPQLSQSTRSSIVCSSKASGSLTPAYPDQFRRRPRSPHL